jgi:hypothetical protein
MTTLKTSSIQGEYYCGDLPGTIQYKKDPSALKALEIPDGPNTLASDWTVINDDSVAQILPATAGAGKPFDWEQILVMQKVHGDRVWLKGALKNKKTGLIALLTGCNTERGMTDHGHRAIKACADNWFVGHYRMAAPLVFWSELKAILNK